MAQFLRIKHTKKGTQKLIRKLANLTLYYVTSGIHIADGKKIESSRVAQWKKDHPKSTLRDNKQNIEDSQKNQDKKSSTRKRKKRYNVATIAYLMEQFVTWTQSKTVKFNNLTIWAGSKMKRPKRIFITFYQIQDKWNSFTEFIKTQIINIMRNQKGNKTISKSFWDNIGKNAKNIQHNSAITSEPNSIVTEIIKQSNVPLLDTGLLLSSIKYKVQKNNRIEYEKLKNYEAIFNMNEFVSNMNIRRM